MNRYLICCVMSAVAAFGCGVQKAQAQSFTFQTFGNAGYTYTQARGFGPGRSVVGYDLSKTFSASGFVTRGTGSIAKILSPTGGAAEVFNYAGGFLLGESSSLTGLGQGFLRDRSAAYTIIAVPKSVSSAPLAMNASGTVVGTYTPSTSTGYEEAGFVLQNGVYTVFAVPGAFDTELTGINNAGTMVGGYTSANQAPVGFILTGGVMTVVACPNANSTYVSGINNTGQVVGYCQIGSFSAGFTGFVFDGKAFTMFTEPGATSTYAFNINDAGQVVGYGLNASGSLGYVATLQVGAAK